MNPIDLAHEAGLAMEKYLEAVENFRQGMGGDDGSRYYLNELWEAYAEIFYACPDQPGRKP